MSGLQQRAAMMPGHASGGAGRLVAGLVLSLLLTLVPFGLASAGHAPRGVVVAVIIAAALLQLLVQLVCFLHLGPGADARWNTLAFAFTAVVVAILVAGTLWIMYNLNYYMMVDIH